MSLESNQEILDFEQVNFMFSPITQLASALSSKLSFDDLTQVLKKLIFKGDELIEIGTKVRADLVNIENFTNIMHGITFFEELRNR